MAHYLLALKATDAMAKELQNVKAATIERCAQVDIIAILKREIRLVTWEDIDGDFNCKIKDGNLEHCAEQIAAAIRAMKD